MSTMSKPNKIPPGCQRVLKRMAEGFTLHSGVFGFWLMSPIDSYCVNVNHYTARALVRRNLIRKKAGEWVRNPLVFEDEYQFLLNEQPPLPALEPNPVLPDLKPVNPQSVSQSGQSGPCNPAPSADAP